MSKGLVFVGLAVVMIPLGIWGGYHYSRTEFEVVGCVRVKPDSPVILYPEAHDKIDPAYFPLYLETQAALINSARVIERATQNPRWRSWKSPVPGDLTEMLRRDLKVVPSGELIEVSITDPDQTMVSIGVQAILGAYMEIESDTERASATQRLEVLEDIRNSRNNQLAAIRKRIADASAASITATTQRTDSGGREQLVLDDLEQEKTKATRDLDEVTRRIEQLNVESPLSGAASVVSYGDAPIGRSLPYPRPQMAAAGGVCGLVLAGFLGLILGSSDRRRASR
jgi:hypothetical protein